MFRFFGMGFLPNNFDQTENKENKSLRETHHSIHSIIINPELAAQQKSKGIAIGCDSMGKLPMKLDLAFAKQTKCCNAFGISKGSFEEQVKDFENCVGLTLR